MEGVPECKVRFPVADFTLATLSSLHELSGEAHAEGSKGKNRQQDFDPLLSTISTHLDVWLPSVIFRTWTAGSISRALVVEVGDVELQVTPRLRCTFTL